MKRRKKMKRDDQRFLKSSTAGMRQNFPVDNQLCQQ